MTVGKAILWDFDGTLVNRPFMWSESILAALDEAVPGHGVTQDQAREHLQTGFPWHTPMLPHPELNEPEMWWSRVGDVYLPIFQALACDDATCRSLNEAIRTSILDPGRYQIFDDVVPTLAALTDAGWRHVILSNHIPELPDLIRRMELDAHFELVLTSGKTGYEKPHPEAFRIARESVPNADRFVMVGDSPSADVAGAEKAGIDAILVRTRADDVRHQADDLFLLVELIATVETGWR